MSEIIKKILESLSSENVMSTKEIAEKGGIPSRKLGCKLTGLKKRRLIESSERGKYKITEKGLEELKKR